MFMLALGFALLIIGVCLLILAPIQAAQNKRRSAETTGNGSEVRRKHGRKKGTTYYIDFVYTVDGVQQELKRVKWPLEPDETKEYTICYNPAKPKDAHVKEFRSANPKALLITGLTPGETDVKVRLVYGPDDLVQTVMLHIHVIGDAEADEDIEEKQVEEP